MRVGGWWVDDGCVWVHILILIDHVHVQICMSHSYCECEELHKSKVAINIVVVQSTDSRRYLHCELVHSISHPHWVCVCIDEAWYNAHP